MQRLFSKKLDNDGKLTGACIFCDGTLENNICAITCYNYIPNCKFVCCKDENSVYYCLECEDGYKKSNDNTECIQLTCLKSITECA